MLTIGTKTTAKAVEIKPGERVQRRGGGLIIILLRAGKAIVVPMTRTDGRALAPMKAAAAKRGELDSFLASEPDDEDEAHADEML